MTYIEFDTSNPQPFENYTPESKRKSNFWGDLLFLGLFAFSVWLYLENSEKKKDREKQY